VGAASHRATRLTLELSGTMKLLCFFVLWCLLAVLSWPVALLVLVLAPLVWLLSLPLQLIGITVGAVFALLRAVLMLPARLLGWRG
jgi:hypothetical protein